MDDILQFLSLQSTHEFVVTMKRLKERKIFYQERERKYNNDMNNSNNKNDYKQQIRKEKLEKFSEKLSKQPD